VSSRPSEVVPDIELRRPARAAVADRPHDQERRGVAPVGARHASSRAGWVVEVGPIRDVEDVHIRHDSTVAVARELESVGGAQARQGEVGSARAIVATLFSTVRASGLDAAPLYVPAGNGSWKMPFRSGSV